jgi:hypothetical protein
MLVAQSKEPIWDDNDEMEEQVSEESHPLWLGGGYATGMDKSQTMYGLQQYFLTVGGHVTSSTWMQYYFSYTHTPLKKTNDPEYLIKDGVSVIELGGEVRRYTPVRYSFFGHYFFGGASAVVAYWKFSSSSVANAMLGNPSSTVWGIDIHFGTGFFLGEAVPLIANLDIIPGITFWFMNTYQGNYDTRMPTWYYLKLRISLGTAIATW